MKLKLFFVLAILSAFAACKTTYKATDRPISLTDSTSSETDSASTLSKPDSTRMPIPPDSTSIPAKPDSTRMPTPPDSTNIPAKYDSTRMPTPPDSTSIPAKPDSTRISPVADSTRMSAKADSTKISPPDRTPSTSVTVSAETRAAFTKQYPGAANDVWANYDSLAAVPIDLRMAGWKRMNAEDHLVKFDLEDENYYAWYDRDGNWVGSAYTMKDPSKLPAAVNATVKNAVNTKYPGYSITNVNREFQKDKKAYEIELKKDNSTVKMLVNSDGKIIKLFKYVKEVTK